MEDLKKTEDWKMTEMAEGGMEAEVGSRMEGRGKGLGSPPPPALIMVVPQKAEEQELMEKQEHAEPMANPMANPMASPMANPMASPMANPMASPMASPMDNPLDNPMANPMGVEDPALLLQCLGHGCVNPCRPGSKYCSDDCGMNLAAERIYDILPERLQQWQNSPSIAEEHGKKMIESLIHEQQGVLNHLKYLEHQYHELEAIIRRGKQQTICKDEESAKVMTNTAQRIFCVSCGKSISVRAAVRHMEHCFAKYECKSSFGSLYPACIEGATRLFCDTYDPMNKRYCKRLHVLCPEHSKEPKVPIDEVCGCPLVQNIFEPTGNFCRLPKRVCIQHYCWEKLRRAELDLERVRALYKMEELSEQEHKVRTSMRNRAGLVGLMLHQTIQHDPLTTDLRSRADD